MRLPVIVCLFVVAAAGAAGPSRANAQTAPEVTPGWTVWVTTADGRTQKGKVADVSSGALGLMVGKQVTSIKLTEVRRIDRGVRDPVADGLGKGALIGAGSGALLGLLSSSCRPSRCAGLDSRAFAVEAGALFGAIVGAITGAVADAVHHERRQVYPAPAPQRLTLFPIASPRAAGIGGVFRW